MGSSKGGGRYVEACPGALARWIDEHVGGEDKRGGLLKKAKLQRSTFHNWRCAHNQASRGTFGRLASQLGKTIEEIEGLVGEQHPWALCCKADPQQRCPYREPSAEVEVGAGTDATPATSLDDEVAHYLAKIEALHHELRLAGFETKVRVPIELDELYVPLDAVIDRSNHRKRRYRAGVDMREETKVPLAKAFEVARRSGGDGEPRKQGVVLLGDPGSGKTTHLKQLLLQVVRHGAESVGLPAGTVPVFVPLRRLRNLEGGLSSFIRQELRDRMLGVAEGFGERLVGRGRLLYLFDGLDEVADAEDRRRVSRWIENLRRAHPDCHVLVSCRISGYTLDAQLDEGFLELHLRPMTSEQVETFVRKWYRIVEGATTEDPEQAMVRAEAGAEHLLETLRRPEMSSTRVYTMTHNPLLLTTICLVHRDRGELPRERVLLYEEAVSVLLERWRTVTKDLNVTFLAREARQVLQPVAEWMHQQPGRIRATADELDEVVSKGLRTIKRDVSAAEFLETIRDESGLLTGWGVDEYGFMHLGFQEYLAAWALKNRELLRSRSGVFRTLAARFGQSWWQEVILLMLAQDQPPMFERFMGEVVQRPEFPKWARSKMMGLCLNEAFGVSEAPFVELLEETEGDETLSARQLAAVQLLASRMPQALVGLEHGLREHPAEEVRAWWRARQRQQGMVETIVAPRGGVELVRIPGGRFVMGSPEDELGRFDRESPQHEVELSEFYLARTPVTNAQYAEYLEANPEAKEPEYWGNREFNQPEQPVVGVSWHEAWAYCEWAGLRLPTEAQREYACRAGTTTRFYSGDDEEDLKRVGWFDENSDDRLHPVGELEPNGFGLYDMHGNVEEWCLDAYEGYTSSPRLGDGLRKEPDGGASRVVRGGVFDDVAHWSRSADRGSFEPDGRYHGLGFRPAQVIP